MNQTLALASWVPCTTAEGPFQRFSIWTQGCSIRCPGCCNPQLFKQSGGQKIRIDKLVAQIRIAQDELGIEGITLVGGEPLDQIQGVSNLSRYVKQLGLGIIIFSGYTIEEARRRPGFALLWDQIDTLVDGPFDPTRSDLAHGRTFIGSNNQELHHRSSRYADENLWRGPNRAEIQIDDQGRISLHGFPSITDRLMSPRSN